MRSHTNLSAIVRLDASEQFRFTTRTGEISVDQLRFTPQDFKVGHRGYTAWCRGDAIKKDGTRALHQRDDYIPFEKIPMVILECGLAALNEHPRITLDEWCDATDDHPEVAQRTNV